MLLTGHAVHLSAFHHMLLGLPRVMKLSHRLLARPRGFRSLRLLRHGQRLRLQPVTQVPGAHLGRRQHGLMPLRI